MNTTKKLTSGQERARRGVQKNGWTPPALRGERLPVYVGFGMEALSTADAEEALSSWPYRNHTHGFLSTESVALYQGKVSLDAGMGGCEMLIDNLQQWME